MKNIETTIDITKEIYVAMLQEFHLVKEEIIKDMVSHDKRKALAIENKEYSIAAKWNDISQGLYYALRLIERKITQLEIASKNKDAK